MLKSIKIEGLYGLYNYSLDFTIGENERLSIITGPNGYGKTTILQLIFALFGKDTELFFQIPFSHILFSIDDYLIRVVQTRTTVQTNDESDLPGDEMVSVHFELEGKRYDQIEGQLELVLNSLKCFYLTDKRVLLRNKEQRKRIENADADSSMGALAKMLAEIITRGDNERSVLFFQELVKFFKFADKEMMLDNNFGVRFKINNLSKTIIPVTALSSGEKHVLLQLFELVFDGKAGDLVIIDEPELSFHPAWLNVYVSVLERIQQFKLEDGRDMQIVLATHSSMLVGGRWDDTIDLYSLRRNG